MIVDGESEVGWIKISKDHFNSIDKKDVLGQSRFFCLNNKCCFFIFSIKACTIGGGIKDSGGTNIDVER